MLKKTLPYPFNCVTVIPLLRCEDEMKNLFKTLGIGILFLCVLSIFLLLFYGCVLFLWHVWCRHSHKTMGVSTTENTVEICVSESFPDNVSQ